MWWDAEPCAYNTVLITFSLLIINHENEINVTFSYLAYVTEQGKHFPAKVLKSCHNTMTLKHYHISTGSYNLVLSSTLLTLTFSWAKWSWLLKRVYFSVFTVRENIPTSKEITSNSVKWNEKGTQIERGFDKVMPLEKLHTYLDHTKFISKTVWGAFQILKTNFNIF